MYPWLRPLIDALMAFLLALLTIFGLGCAPQMTPDQFQTFREDFNAQMAQAVDGLQHEGWGPVGAMGSGAPMVFPREFGEGLMASLNAALQNTDFTKLLTDSHVNVIDPGVFFRIRSTNDVGICLSEVGATSDIDLTAESAARIAEAITETGQAPGQAGGE